MGTAILGRPHAERIRLDLNEIRKELTETLEGMSSDDLNWVPNPDAEMRSVKNIVQEIGAMEAVTLHMAAYQKDLDWNGVMESLNKDSAAELLAVLSDIRSTTLAYLENATEEQLETPVALNAEWQGYFNAPVVEPEELLRWIVRHEYYHLGQIVTYQWQRGKNPSALSQ
ncbi:MAG: DinB family protein [Armatimonadota bacterium]